MGSKRTNKKPMYYYELNSEAAKNGLSNEDMAQICAISPSTYSLKKNGKYPWLLSECKALCDRFNRSIYGFFIPASEYPLHSQMVAESKYTSGGEYGSVRQQTRR